MSFVRYRGRSDSVLSLSQRRILPLTRDSFFALQNINDFGVPPPPLHPNELVGITFMLVSCEAQRGRARTEESVGCMYRVIRAVVKSIFCLPTNTHIQKHAIVINICSSTFLDDVSLASTSTEESNTNSDSESDSDSSIVSNEVGVSDTHAASNEDTVSNSNSESSATSTEDISSESSSESSSDSSSETESSSGEEGAS